jgi:hypothetical protein
MIKLTTKAKAQKMLAESKNNPNENLVRMKYFSGKCKSGAFPEGAELIVSEDVRAVWSEPRNDKYGRYCLLYCLIEKQTTMA